MTKQEYANIKADEFNLLASMGVLDDVLDQLDASYTTKKCISFKIDNEIKLECVDNNSYIMVDSNIITLETNTNIYIQNYIDTHLREI